MNSYPLSWIDDCIDSLVPTFENNLRMIFEIFRKFCGLIFTNFEIKFQLFMYIFRKSFANLLHKFLNLINI